MTTPNYGFLRDRPEVKKAQMQPENTKRSQRFKNYPRPVTTNRETLTLETQADITRKFNGMVQTLLTYHVKLSPRAAEARVRAVLHTTYPDLGSHEGEEEAPVEEMFRFNEAEDVKVVARMVEEEKEMERQREEDMKMEAETEKEWVLVEKKKNKKEAGGVLGVRRNAVVVHGRGRAGAVLGVVRNGAPRGGLRGRGSFEAAWGRGRGFGWRGGPRLQ